MSIYHIAPPPPPYNDMNRDWSALPAPTPETNTTCKMQHTWMQLMLLQCMGGRRWSRGLTVHLWNSLESERRLGGCCASGSTLPIHSSRRDCGRAFVARVGYWLVCTEETWYEFNWGVIIQAKTVEHAGNSVYTYSGRESEWDQPAALTNYQASQKQQPHPLPGSRRWSWISN